MGEFKAGVEKTEQAESIYIRLRRFIREQAQLIPAKIVGGQKNPADLDGFKRELRNGRDGFEEKERELFDKGEPYFVALNSLVEGMSGNIDEAEWYQLRELIVSAMNSIFLLVFEDDEVLSLKESFRASLDKARVLMNEEVKEDYVD